MFGVFSLLVILSTFILLRNGFKQMSRIFVALICVTMYAMAATHFALTVRTAFLNASISMSQLDVASQCLWELSEGMYCSESIDSMLTGAVQQGTCIPTSLLTVNIILSDSIVLWRAWVLWSKRRLFIVISAILVLTTLIISLLNVRSDSVCPPGGEVGWAFYDFDSIYGLSAVILSLLTNIWATSLIAYKAWEHRQSVRRMFRGGSIGVRSAKILMLFVDSGLLYCGLWALLTITVATDQYYKGRSSTMSLFINDTGYIFITVLVDIVGMYPTALVLLVSLTDYTVENTMRIVDTADMPVRPLKLNRPRNTIRSEDVLASRPTVIFENGDPYIQSVIAILGDETRSPEEETKSGALGNAEDVPAV
ncbi:uncharacterized protein PHACADRAFT_203941 [Phanerochaete carnosa HHB-10118-sp]|uniref:Uncharacterized protein n=1 Tax=Phanerochaete carnosa (strain HHB-10118-sp) TaxID=650164 RepID=K5WMZ1_PHACS|nr:uncharacterized protein PHACADRAFT_203941 [Phanerochaete carnosa HHB-10118-sp]EKM60790.1 hypothetical protein PHACADRAFT_203941 [Phanerochaete carnosa HHB-10118-sp]